ncbi:MAG: DegT/DnrJ/EryC1/StrS family aminotransferase [Pirellulales bacterium]
MREQFLPFAPPSITESEIDAVVQTLRNGWLSTGPNAKKFQELFLERCGGSSALAVNSCTAALHLALVAHGIGPGDEVITTPLTFVSTVNVIEMVGATPVLVDVEEETLNIDPSKIRAAITSKTKAIIPVHYAGHPIDRKKINNIAKDHGLAVIEDAAHGTDARIDGEPLGNTSNLVAYSFYATKNITTAEGGMLTGPSELIEKCRTLSLHGLSRQAWGRYKAGGSWKYDVLAAGYKYNMSDLQASLGIAQIQRIEELTNRRTEIARKYNQAFSSNPVLKTLSTKEHVGHAWHLYVLRLNLPLLEIGRDDFLEALTKLNIGTSVHFIPIQLHSFYRNKYRWAVEDTPVAFNAFERMISLPIFPAMTDQDIEDVIEAVDSVVSQNVCTKRHAA